MKFHLLLTVLFSASFLMQSFSQNAFKISGGDVIQAGGYLIIKDCKIINDGNFESSEGNVSIKGTETDVNTSISGTGTSSFYDLTIDKSSNNAELDMDIEVNNTLYLTDGLLNLKTSNLTITSGGTTSGYSSDSYVQTSSTGTLNQTVSNTDVVFPLGKNTFSPATLNNAGTEDVFSIRVNDEVWTEGTTGNEISSNNVDLTWYVNEETDGNSDVTLTLQWNDTDELTGFDRDNCFVSHFDGTDWSENISATAIGSNPYIRSLSNIIDFSPFTVTSDITVLPVELISFKAKKRGTQALLEWATASELNNDYFDIEWGTDGEHFEWIASQRGAGTTSIEQYYQQIHKTPSIGLNYYRLKQVDFDGSFEYSQIEVLDFSREDISKVNIYPNPASDYLIIQSNDSQHFQLFDVNGKQLMSQLIPIGGKVNISQLGSGTYFIKLGVESYKITII